MRMSKLYIPTLKEAPAEAEIPSYQLLLRAGMIRKRETGIFSYLPLGLRVVRKIENIIREELDKLGAQELLTSNVQENGEYIIPLLKKDVSSYKQLPLTFYHVHTKHKEESKPKFGLIEAKEYITIDAYSCDRDVAGMESSYASIKKAYERIFERLKLKYKVVEGEKGHEFIALEEIGEETFVYCESCNYAANSKFAEVIYDMGLQDIEEKTMEKVYTPNATTIEDLEAFFGLEKRKFAKSLIYVAGGEPILVVIPGDRDLNEVKLCNYLGISPVQLEMADEGVVREITNAEKGFAGPVEIKAGTRIIVDSRITKMKNLIVGGNETDYHIKNVNYGRDFKGEVVGDLLVVKEGEPCPQCGKPLQLDKGIKIGHISQLGTKCSEALNANFLDEDGKEKPFVIASYSLNISRIFAALVEQNNDENGIVWPLAVAPYHVAITVVKVKDEEQLKLGEYMYKKLKEEGIEVLLDDRNERAGVKFKDRDLIGLPIRITVGKRAAENIVEYSLRSHGERIEVSADEALERLREQLKLTLIKG